MLSQRGQMMLVHNRHQREGFRRVMNAIQVNGVDAEWLEADEVFAREPTLNRNGRYPILGAVNQARAGTARHDAVAWGSARAAAALGVDIIPQYVVHGFQQGGNNVSAVQTNHGSIYHGGI